MPPQKQGSKNPPPQESPKDTPHLIENTPASGFANFEFAKDSLIVSQGILKNLNHSVDRGIQSIEAVKKLPDYNTEYCLEIAANVNDVSIKTYDIKADDGIFTEPKMKKPKRGFMNYSMSSAIEEEQEPDPKRPGADAFMLEKVIVKKKPALPNKEMDARSSRARKPDNMKLQRKFSRNELKHQTSSIMQQIRNEIRSPGLQRKKSGLRVQIIRDDGTARTPSGLSPEPRSYTDKAAPLTTATPNRILRKPSLRLSSRAVGEMEQQVKLDMSFKKEIKYEDDGEFDERQIDKMRAHLLAHQGKEKDKSFRNQAFKHNSVKMMNPGSRHPSVSPRRNAHLLQNSNSQTLDPNREKSLSEMKNMFNKDQKSHVYENGTFVPSSKFNIERLPELKDSNKHKVRVHQKEMQVHKPGEFIMVPAPGQAIKSGQQPQMIRKRVFDAKEQVLNLKRMHEIKKNIAMIMMNKEKLEEFKHKSKIADESAANANHRPLLRQRPSVSMSIGVLTDVRSETEELQSQDPPPLDMKRMEHYSSKEPITNFIKQKYLKHQDNSQNQVPNRQCLKINYGVVYKEPHDSQRQLGAFKLEGAPFLESPDNRDKLTRGQFLAKQRNATRPYFSQMPSEDKSTSKKIEVTSGSMPDLQTPDSKQRLHKMGTNTARMAPRIFNQLNTATIDKRNRREVAASMGIEQLHVKLEQAVLTPDAVVHTQETLPDWKQAGQDQFNQESAIMDNLNVNRSVVSEGNHARSTQYSNTAYNPGMGRLVQQILLKKQSARNQSQEFNLHEVEMRKNAKTGLVRRDKMAVMNKIAAREMSTFCQTEAVGEFDEFPHHNASSSEILERISLNNTSLMPISQQMMTQKLRKKENWLVHSKIDGAESVAFRDRVVKKNLESISSNMMNRRMNAQFGTNPFGSPKSKNIAQEMVMHHRRDSTRYVTQKQIRKKVL